MCPYGPRNYFSGNGNDVPVRGRYSRSSFLYLEAVMKGMSIIINIFSEYISIVGSRVQ